MEAGKAIKAVLAGVLVIAAYAGVRALLEPGPPPQPTAEGLIVTDYSTARAGDCVRFSGPGEDDIGVSMADCERASLRVGAVLSTSNGPCPRGEYKVLRDTRHNAALCLLPNAREGDCFELDTEDLQSSVVVKFDCAAPRATVRVVGVRSDGCPAGTEIGLPYEGHVLCLRRVVRSS